MTTSAASLDQAIRVRGSSSQQTSQEGKVTMKSSIRQAWNFRTTGRKAVIALAFASLISGLSISPAFADKHDGHDNGNRHGNKHGQREWRGDRDGYRDGYRGGYYYRPEYRQPYIYAQPVYVPPPVYYEPQQSPGISLFFPLDLRR